MKPRDKIIGTRTILVPVLAFLFLATAAHAKTVQMGILYDGDAGPFAAMKQVFIHEIQSMTQGAHTVNFPTEAMLSGGWDTRQINRALDRLLASDKVDMILVLGHVATHEACRRSAFTKPVFAAGVVSAKLQGFPSSRGTSGILNLNYIDTMRDLERELQRFRKMVPYTRITIVMDDLSLRSIPCLNAQIRRIAGTLDLYIDVVRVTESTDGLWEKISKDTDAVFLDFLPRLPDKGFRRLAQDLIARKLPSYSFQGMADVKRGILAGALPQGHSLHLARCLAVNILEVLNGVNAGQVPTVFAPGEKLSVNMATAKAIGRYPNWDILSEAELIDDEPADAGQQVTITMVMEEALAANPELGAENRSVEAGLFAVKEAQSSLLPRLDLLTRGTLVDDDRAFSASGTLPERQWTGTLQATQLIYSDKAWAGYTVEKRMQDSREKARDAVQLDIREAAAVTYLNVLRALSIEKIQKENLKLTRENLEQARIRVEIGAGGPEEIYRWESQIADSRRNVLSAQSVTLDAVSRMNRILNRPLSQPFAPAEADLSNPLDILPDQRITRYMDNAMALERLKDFLVMEGLAVSPELEQNAAAIDAQKRKITLARREFWVPEVSLFSEAAQSLSKGGKGSEYPPERDDTDWSIGIRATLPLYSGGKKFATLNRYRKELERMQHERDSLSDRIEENCLNAVHHARATYPGIRFSQDAAEAARLNLTLVTDSYSRGIKSIIDLIDAQNQTLVSNQQAVNAVYDFLIDVMAIQRSVGKFFLFEPEKERDAWTNRLNRHMDGAM